MSDGKPIIIAWLKDPTRVEQNFTPDRIYEQLLEEVYDPDIYRSHVITLHLYVEYWLNRILEKLNKKNQGSFHRNLEELNKLKVFESQLYENLKCINQLRNIYAHELDLKKANSKVEKLIDKMQLDPYFSTNDQDMFRSICLQTMYLLEATFNNDCKPPKLDAFPHEEVQKKFKKDGKIFWQDCEILSKRQTARYIEEFDLRCPNCLKGVIVREKDSTPGFKESDMSSCEVCGTEGDGSYIYLPKKKRK